MLFIVFLQTFSVSWCVESGAGRGLHMSVPSFFGGA